jgi:hypothetical protein
MSWAARRETTVLEDEAYCLQGLFDITIKSNYGEREKAFERLQLDIMKKFSGEAILAWDSPVHRSHVEYSGFLARSPREFTNCAGVIIPGRHSEGRYFPRRGRPSLEETAWGLKLQGSAIPIRPKQNAEQIRSVRKDPLANSAGRDGKARYWAIPLTSRYDNNETHEYPAILIVVKRRPDEPVYLRVELLSWRPGGPTPHEVLAKYYAVCGPTEEDKCMYLNIRKV